MTKTIENYKKYLYMSVSDFSKDIELFKEIVLANLDEDVKKEVQDEDLNEYFNDENSQDYAVQIVVNSITSKIKALLYSRSLKVMEGYLLPAVDLLTGGKEKFGQVPTLKGMKLPFLTEDAGSPLILTLNKWSNSSTLNITKDENQTEDLKIPIPYFYRVRIRVSVRGGDKVNEGFKYSIQSIDAIDSTSEISIPQLKEIFEDAAVPPEQVSKSDKSTFVLINNIRWRYANPLELWGLSDTEFIEKDVLDNQTGLAQTRINPITHQLEKVTEQLPKPIRDPQGQPFIQEKFGSEPPKSIKCFRLSANSDIRDSKLQLKFDLFNNRLADPIFWIFSKEVIFNQAIELGLFTVENAKENPYNIINQSYMGTELFVLGVLTDIWDGKTNNEPVLNMGFSSSMIITKDFEYLPTKQTPLPFNYTKSLTGINIPDNFHEDIEPFNFMSGDTKKVDTFEEEESYDATDQEIAEDAEIEEEEIVYPQNFLDYINTMETLFQEPVEGMEITLDDVDSVIATVMMEYGYLEFDGKKVTIIKPLEPFPELLEVFDKRIKELQVEKDKEEKKAPSKKKKSSKSKAIKKPKKDNVIVEGIKEKLVQQSELKQADKQTEATQDGLSLKEMEELLELERSLKEIMEDSTFADVEFEDLLETGFLPSWVNSSHKNLVNDILLKIKG